MQDCAQPCSPTLHGVLVAQWCRLLLHTPGDTVVLLTSLSKTRETQQALWAQLQRERPEDVCKTEGQSHAPQFVYQYDAIALNEQDLMPQMRRAFAQHVQLRSTGLNLLTLRNLSLTPTMHGSLCVSVRYEQSWMPWRTENRRRLFHWHRGQLQLMREHCD